PGEARTRAGQSQRLYHDPMNPELFQSLNRRKFLHQTGLGFGGLALNAIAQGSEPSGIAHRAAKAKSVIWLFMRGGVSHMESFDPKPALTQYAGKSIPETPYAGVLDPGNFKDLRVVVVNDANGKQRNEIYPLQVGYRKYG